METVRIQDPGSGMEKSRIWDPASGINIPDPKHWVQYVFCLMIFCCKHSSNKDTVSRDLFKIIFSP
jgi:hypothetical protein